LSDRDCDRFVSNTEHGRTTTVSGIGVPVRGLQSQGTATNLEDPGRPAARCDNLRVIEAALRAAAVPPFHAMAMSREATALEASGRRILHLEVGQPSTPLPRRSPAMPCAPNSIGRWATRTPPG
jgi:hypothetical protein